MHETSAHPSSHIEPGTMPSQPLFPLTKIWHHLVDLISERICVIPRVEMTELVDHDVVEDSFAAPYQDRKSIGSQHGTSAALADAIWILDGTP